MGHYSTGRWELCAGKETGLPTGGMDPSTRESTEL
jgi:hypothetical protein